MVEEVDRVWEGEILARLLIHKEDCVKMIGGLKDICCLKGWSQGLLASGIILRSLKKCWIIRKTVDLGKMIGRDKL